MSCDRFFCRGIDTGMCDQATQVRDQGRAGFKLRKGVTRKQVEKAWDNYIERVRKQVLPECAHPDQLQDAIDNTIPDI